MWRGKFGGTADSLNNGHFGTPASVLYSESVLYWGALVKHLPLGLNNAIDTLDTTIAYFNNILADVILYESYRHTWLRNRAILLITGCDQIHYVCGRNQAWKKRGNYCHAHCPLVRTFLYGLTLPGAM